MTKKCRKSAPVAEADSPVSKKSPNAHDTMRRRNLDPVTNLTGSDAVNETQQYIHSNTYNYFNETQPNEEPEAEEYPYNKSFTTILRSRRMTTNSET